MKSGLGTRGRAIFSSIVIGIIVFVVSSPIAQNAYESFFPPSEVSNIKVTEKNGEVDLLWATNPEGDVVAYDVSIDGQTGVRLDSQATAYSFYHLDNNRSYSVAIYALDNSGKSSTPIVITVQPKDKSATAIYNIAAESNSSRDIALASIAIAVLLFVLTLWVLFFKVSRKTMFTIAAFPSFCIIPLLIFSFTLIASLNAFSNKLLVSLVVFVAATVTTYLLLLTTNILNGSMFNDLPLIQAGKASQFIFSLVSTYLILIYAFGSYQDFALRIIISLPFIYYFSYSSIWMNKHIDQSQVFMRASAITLIMALTLMVLSIWPIEAVYAILAASVIFYILLNVALEIRKHLNRTVWVEYGVLTVLILILLFANGFWGINGSLL